MYKLDQYFLLIRRLASKQTFSLNATNNLPQVSEKYIPTTS
jgi:hypothetical protein